MIESEFCLRESERERESVCVCVCVCAWMRACVCVCLRELKTFSQSYIITAMCSDKNTFVIVVLLTRDHLINLNCCLDYRNEDSRRHKKILCGFFY